MTILSIFLLAASTISSPDLGNYCETDWMPDTVSSTATYGSSDFVTNRALTATNAAAYRAIYEARLERAYLWSAGISNIWDEAEYGSRRPYLFDFGDTYAVSTNVRYHPFPRRSICDRGVRESITATLRGGTNSLGEGREVLLGFYPLIRRPSWSGDGQNVTTIFSSTMTLPNDNPLDQGLTAFAWTQTPTNQLDWTTHGVGLAALSSDGYGINNAPHGENVWQQIYYFVNTFGGSLPPPTGAVYPYTILDLFAAAYSNHTDYADFVSPSASLLASHGWAGTSARILAAADRTYSLFSPSSEQVNMRTITHTNQKRFQTNAIVGDARLACDDSGRIYWEFVPPVTLSESDWYLVISGEILATNDVGVYETGTRCSVGEISDYIGFSADDMTFSATLFATELYDKLAGYASGATNIAEFTVASIPVAGNDDGTVGINFDVTIDDSYTIWIAAGRFDLSYLVFMPTYLTVTRSYNHVETDPNFKTDWSSPVAPLIRPCSYSQGLANSYCYTFDWLQYSVDGEPATHIYRLQDHGGYTDPYAVLRRLNDSRQSMILKSRELINSLSGDYTDATVYAPIGSAYATGTLRSGAIGGNCGKFKVKFNSTGEIFAVWDYGAQRWNGADISTVVGNMTVTVNPPDFTALTIHHDTFNERDPVSAVGRLKPIMRTDWKYRTLRRAD